MNNYKCINPKNYKLTADREYTPTNIADGNIYLTNDRGVQAKYSLELFEEIPEVPPQLTNQQILDSIDPQDDNFTFYNRDNEEVVINNPLQCYDSAISCGIKQVIGISTLMETIDNNVVDQNLDFEVVLQKTILERMLMDFIESNSVGAITLLSTNLTDDEDDVPYINLCNYMTEISHFHSIIIENPNSNNEIQLWGFYNDQL